MADVLQAAGSGEDPQVPGDFKLPSKEELLAAIETMGLTEEQKKELLEGIRAGELGGIADEEFPGLGAPPLGIPDGAAKGVITLDIMWVLILVSLVLIVLVFFGYKLYKSLVDRDRRREEKKRHKLQKKKK